MPLYLMLTHLEWLPEEAECGQVLAKKMTILFAATKGTDR